MKTQHNAAGFGLGLLIALMIHGSGTVRADEQAKPNTLTKQEQADGWKLLFDGKTLDGWLSWKTRKPLASGGWVVQDDALHLAGKGGGDIYTDKTYENFELSLEYKTTGNSGIFIRVNPEVKGAIYSVAPEIQVHRDGGTGSTSAGGLYALYPIEGEKVIHPDGWNQVKIRLQNDHGVHWFNGNKVYEYTIGSDDWNARLAKSKFRDSKGFGLTAKGHIGLQDHGASVAFRNIKIRVLDGDEK